MSARNLGPPGKRRGGPHPEAAHTVEVITTDKTKVTDTDDQDALPRCGLCDEHREPAWPGHPWCAKCVRDLGDALNRRRAAELRLPPIDRGQS